MKLLNKYGKELLGDDLKTLRRAKRDLEASLEVNLENKTIKAMAVQSVDARLCTYCPWQPRLKGDVTPPGFLTVLGQEDVQVPGEYAINNSSGKRRYLAEWITREDNPDYPSHRKSSLAISFW